MCDCKWILIRMCTLRKMYPIQWPCYCCRGMTKSVLYGTNKVHIYLLIHQTVSNCLHLSCILLWKANGVKTPSRAVVLSSWPNLYFGLQNSSINSSQSPTSKHCHCLLRGWQYIAGLALQHRQGKIRAKVLLLMFSVYLYKYSNTKHCFNTSELPIQLSP